MDSEISAEASATTSTQVSFVPAGASLQDDHRVWDAVPELPAVAILRGESSEWRVLTHMVGKGGAGKVFPAYSRSLDLEAAVKVMHLSGHDSESFSNEVFGYAFEIFYERLLEAMCICVRVPNALRAVR